MIQWGIIGCGDVAEVKSGPAFQLAKESELVAVMRRNGAKAADFAKRHNVPHWYDDADALLANDQVNAVYVATPPSTHLHYAKAAINAGKHVYIEKPMALNVEEALELEAFVANAEQKVTIAHYRRELPAFLKVGELLKSGAIGRVLFADISILQPAKSAIVAQSEDNWRLNPTVSGGGYFYDLAPHQIDLMCTYFGKYRSATGVSATQSETATAPDMTTGIIDFENGIQFRGVWCFHTEPEAACERCVIHGTGGTLEFSFYGSEVLLKQQGHQKQFTFEPEKHVQQPMIQRTVDYFLGKGTNPCSVSEAVTVATIMAAFS